MLRLPLFSLAYRNIAQYFPTPLNARSCAPFAPLPTTPRNGGALPRRGARKVASDHPYGPIEAWMARREEEVSVLI
jgi:hypothetical protein